MPPTSRKLLDQLIDLQSSLEGFSFDFLSTQQALELKNTFDTFRNQLEHRIWSPEVLRDERISDEPEPDNGLPPQADEATATSLEQPESDASIASDDLIALVSHEIRTPLNGISGFSDILRESTLDTEQKKCVEAIRSASGSMLEMVNALLDYHKVCRGLDQPATVSFSPAQVLEEIHYLCKTLILDTQLQFDFHVAEGLPAHVQGDPSRFTQILMNLLGNAIKFTKEGRIGMNVRHSTHQGVCEICCEISDTGPGIPQDDLKRVFLPYAKVRSRSRVSGEGLGLGLSLVSQWTQQMGGEVSVKSRKGVGSTFRLRLPFEIIQKAKDGASDNTSNKVSQLSGKHILIFEDNPLNMKLAETRLKGWGCIVYQALHYQQGFKVLEQQPLDLILMDLRMPGMDGYEVSTRIRNHEDPQVRNTPIIALTADFTPEVQQRIAECGINDLVLKPYKPEDLSGTMLDHLQAKKESSAKVEEIWLAKDMARPVDLGRLWDDCGQDLEMLQEMIRLFQNGVLEFLGALAIHSKTPDYQEIRAAAHKIKAGLKLLEAKTWIEHVECIQELARKETNAARIRGHYEALKSDFPRLEEALIEQVNELKSQGGHV